MEGLNKLLISDNIPYRLFEPMINVGQFYTITKTGFFFKRDKLDYAPQDRPIPNLFKFDEQLDFRSMTSGKGFSVTEGGNVKVDQVPSQMGEGSYTINFTSDNSYVICLWQPQYFEMYDAEQTLLAQEAIGTKYNHMVVGEIRAKSFLIIYNTTKNTSVSFKVIVGVNGVQLDADSVVSYNVQASQIFKKGCSKEKSDEYYNTGLIKVKSLASFAQPTPTPTTPTSPTPTAPVETVPTTTVESNPPPTTSVPPTPVETKEEEVKEQETVVQPTVQA